MNETEARNRVWGCQSTALDDAICKQFVSWVLGRGAAPGNIPSCLAWALAHCDDGVTWGRYDAQQALWRLGNQVAPEVAPEIQQETLQELRLFGRSAEVLIWRTSGGFCGRVLRDTESADDGRKRTGPLRPLDESRILLGTRVLAHCDQGFTHVGDGTGAQQVLPILVTDAQLQEARVRVEVRHYFQSQNETGAVRIAVTRLVGLTSEGSHGA